MTWCGRRSHENRRKGNSSFGAGLFFRTSGGGHGASAEFTGDQFLVTRVTDHAIAGGAAEECGARDAGEFRDRRFHCRLPTGCFRSDTSACAVVPWARACIAADSLAYSCCAASVQSELGGAPVKAASAAFCSSYVSGLGSAIMRSMSGRDWPRFLVRCFPATTIQTGKHGDRKSSVQIHRPLRQHRSAALITCLHRLDCNTLKNGSLSSGSTGPVRSRAPSTRISVGRLDKRAPRNWNRSPLDRSPAVP